MKNLVWLLLFVSFRLFGQNLIPNPSFELYSNCPSSHSAINLVFDWFSPTNGTPDLYNSCSFIPQFSVPQNSIGYQNAKHGNSYVGISTFYRNYGYSDIREYIETKLITPMEAGEIYNVSIYVNLADSCRLGIRNIGMAISSDTIDSVASPTAFYPPILFPVAVANGQTPFVDKEGWQLISGLYLANGGEEYFAIGNFSNDFNTDTFQVGSQTNDWKQQAYYFIDDVSIFRYNKPSDTVVCKGDSITIGVGAVPNVTYSWFPTNGLSNSNIAQPKASPTETTTYYLTTSVEEQWTYTDTLIVHVRNFNLGNDTSICQGERIQVGIPNESGVTYSWIPFFEVENSESSITQAFPQFSRTFILTATFPEGCVYSDEIHIQVKPKIELYGDAGLDGSVCNNSSYTIGTSEEQNLIYSWDPTEGLSSPNSGITVAEPTKDTYYKLTISSNQECSEPYIDSVLVEVCPEDELYIPNVFSLNNDGVNDKFEIKNLPPNSGILIYNRWGAEIASITNKNFWDGKDKSGEECNEGVYYYLISNGKKQFRGSLVLTK